MKLLDDPSEVVREEVRKALLPLAPQIADLLKIFPASPDQILALQRMLFSWRKSQLLARWPRWRATSHPVERLEAFHDMICEFELAWSDPLALSGRIDQLAADCQGKDATELPAALFSQRLRGNSEDYYDPANSYVGWVLRQGRGNPISLCCILMMVGQRLGHEFRGCAFPHHFLARFEGPDGLVLIDCFRGGKLLDPSLTPELRGDLPLATVRELVKKPAPVDDIAARVLRNLVAAYTRLENREHACLFDLLLKDLLARSQGRGGNLALRESLFTPGQVVRHRHKDYRGVIIDYELYHEDTQRPLYRILVHGSPQVASAVEADLELDSGGLVAHQLVSVFFSRFEGGVYLRNSRPWEGTF